jgi:hypothetical protein
LWLERIIGGLLFLNSALLLPSWLHAAANTSKQNVYKELTQINKIMGVWRHEAD